MKILVTGGAGFIASQIVDAYLALGHEVAIIDNLSTGDRKNLNPKARFYELDLRGEAAAKVVEDFKPEVLNLHGAQIDVRKSVGDVRFDADTNIGGTINMVEAARRGGALKRVVYAASGGSMYGDAAQVPTPETAPPAGVSPYAVSKFTGELYLSCFKAMYGLHYVALRYANVYGPRQNLHGEAGVVAIFAQRLLAGQAPLIHWDGEQRKDYVHVRDVAAANMRALEAGSGEAFNLGGGVATSVNELYAELERQLKSGLAPRYGPKREGDVRLSSLAIDKAARLLGWRPRVALAEGMVDTVAFFRAQRARETKARA